MSNVVSGIYCITNMKNNKKYIGSSINIKKRWKRHLKDLKNGNHHSKHLQRSWGKYGDECFKFEVLEIVSDKKMLVDREQYFINLYQSYKPENGFNISPTAGSCLGVKHSKETLKKHSKNTKKWHINNKGTEKYQVYLKNLSNSLKGHKLSIETRKKISESRKGNDAWNKGKTGIYNQETLTRMSESKKGENNCFYGKTHSDDYKLMMSKANRGSNNKSSKLTEDDVIKIKMLLDEGSYSYEKLASFFNVTSNTIGAIKRGETWKHVTTEVIP